MPASGPAVLVVGAGISGLTTAVCLAEARLSVEVRADRPPPASTRCGPQIAPATAEVVSGGGRSARTSTDRPASARQTAVVRPDTPAPTTSTSGLVFATPRR